MEEIFTSILEHLKAAMPELKWIDLQKGQMKYERPPVVFPAALIKIAIPKTENITKKLQLVDAMIQVSFCFDFTGRTNSKMLTAERTKSLAYLKTCDKGHKTLQGFENATFSSLTRTSAIEQERPDDYKVMEMVYTTKYREDTN
jgi:hypothetical protein